MLLPVATSSLRTKTALRARRFRANRVILVRQSHARRADASRCIYRAPEPVDARAASPPPPPLVSENVSSSRLRTRLTAAAATAAAAAAERAACVACSPAEDDEDYDV